MRSPKPVTTDFSTHPLCIDPYLGSPDTIRYLYKIVNRFYGNSMGFTTREDLFQVAYLALLECYPKASCITVPQKRIAYCIKTIVGKMMNSRFSCRQARQHGFSIEYIMTDFDRQSKNACSSTPFPLYRYIPGTAPQDGKDPFDIPYFDTEDDEHIKEIRSLLPQLSPLQADTVMRILTEPVNIKTIAEERGVSPQAVSRQFQQAKTKLQKLIADRRKE